MILRIRRQCYGNNIKSQVLIYYYILLQSVTNVFLGKASLSSETFSRTDIRLSEGFMPRKQS